MNSDKWHLANRSCLAAKLKNPADSTAISEKYMLFGLFLTVPLSRHSTRELPFRPNEMASVAIRVALQVVLMFRLGFPEGAGLGDFRDNLSAPKPGGFGVRDRGLCDPCLIAAGVENRRAIAGPPIVALPIHSRRIVNLKKEFQELP